MNPSCMATQTSCEDDYEELISLSQDIHMGAFSFMSFMTSLVSDTLHEECVLAKSGRGGKEHKATNEGGLAPSPSPHLKTKEVESQPKDVASSPAPMLLTKEVEKSAKGIKQPRVGSRMWDDMATHTLIMVYEEQ